jgi:hypothetical protein
VRAIETLFAAVGRSRQAADVELDFLPRISTTRIDSGPAADVQLLPPTRMADLDAVAAIQALTRRDVPAVLARASIEMLMTDSGHVVGLHIPQAGIEEQLVAEMAAAGIGVAFMERRAVYPLIVRHTMVEAGP